MLKSGRGCAKVEGLMADDEQDGETLRLRPALAADGQREVSPEPYRLREYA